MHCAFLNEKQTHANFASFLFIASDLGRAFAWHLCMVRAARAFVTFARSFFAGEGEMDIPIITQCLPNVKFFCGIEPRYSAIERFTRNLAQKKTQVKVGGKKKKQKKTVRAFEKLNSLVKRRNSFFQHFILVF